MALASIGRLKALAVASGAELWPNHDMTFFREHDRFPAWYS
jgi:N-acyl homoserine lactone hydrolase